MIVEKEIEWFRSELLPKILKNGKLIKNYTEDKADKFKLQDVILKFIGTDEAFMLTICFRTTITFEFEGEISTKYLIVKKTPDLPVETFDEINFPALFYNEIHTYNVILPALQEFSHEGLKFPNFYFGELKRGFAAAALEDFGPLGWRICPQRYNLSLPHIMLAVKYLAKFHGIGFALRQVNRERFDTLTNVLKESRFHGKVPLVWQVKYTASLTRLQKAVHQYQPTIDEKLVQGLLNLMGDMMEFGQRMVKPVEPIVTLCHGDYLRNNIAFKYDENNASRI